jgi:hypothetical protein
MRVRSLLIRRSQHQIATLAEQVATTIATAPQPASAGRQFGELLRAELALRGLPTVPSPSPAPTGALSPPPDGSRSIKSR